MEKEDQQECSRDEKMVRKHITLYANLEKKKSAGNLSLMNEPSSTWPCMSPNILSFQIKTLLCERSRHYSAQYKSLRCLAKENARKR